MAGEHTYPVRLESRLIECQTEEHRELLRESHLIYVDNDEAKRHPRSRLQKMVEACKLYRLRMYANIVEGLVDSGTDDETAP
jgi:hypothetical protein